MPPTEYEVEAAFLHHIARLVTWPAAVSASGSLRLCVLGQGQFSAAAETLLRGKTIDNLIWELMPPGTITPLRECQVVFIEASESRGLPHLLDRLKDAPILTVGNTEGYAERGVMVNFYLEQSKVRFEVNANAAKRSGLRLGSQLMGLARIVQSVGGER